MTKAKHVSRVITLALSMMMVVAMAVPAFANTRDFNDGRYEFGVASHWNTLNPDQVSFSPLVWNVGRSGGSSQNLQPITLYSEGIEQDQMFIFQRSGRDNRPRMYNVANYNPNLRTGWSFNRHSGNNSCILYNDNQDDYLDSQIDALTRFNNPRACYIIALENRGTCLTMRNNSVGTALYFDTNVESINQKWNYIGA
ncbi:MAG: hypothetical protein RR978_01995 [Oscillospiraceae bacterium]